MNSFIKNNYITEMKCDTNFSYILQDNNLFQTIEYKVLQNPSHSNFVSCAKMLFNGKIQLYYITNECKTFASMLFALDTDNMLTIVANLFADIIDVKNIGFLSCQNIDISFEHIYVEPQTYKVKLIYVPTNVRMHEDYAGMERELRTGLRRLIYQRQKYASQKERRLLDELSDYRLSIEDIYSRIIKNRGIEDEIESETKLVEIDTEKSKEIKKEDKVVKNMYLTTLNAASELKLKITKDEYVIGKNPEMADGVIKFSKMISRVHCKINRTEDGFTITDLQSTNGTFLNRNPLAADIPHNVNHGDIIRLANIDFKVTIV